MGAPDVEQAPGDGLWPLFPLALVHDLPFLVIQGYTLAGKAENPNVQIEFCASS